MRGHSLLLASALGIAVGCNVTTIAPPFDNGPTPDQPPSAPVFNGAVVQASTPPVPISGGSLVVFNPSSGPALAVLSDPDEDAIDVVRIAEQPTLVGTIRLQPGDEPGRLVADPHGQVHVALRRGGAVVTIDPTAPSILSRRDVCPAPRGLDYDPSSDSLLVACATGELVTLPATGGAPTRTVRLDRDLRDVLVSGQNVYVTRFRSAEVLTLDATGAVVRRDTPLSRLSGMAPDVAWRTVLAPTGTPVMLHQLASTMAVSVAVPPGVSAYGDNGSNSSIPSGGIVTTAVSEPLGNNYLAGASDSMSGRLNPAVDMALVPQTSPYYYPGAAEVLGLGGTVLTNAQTFPLSSDPMAEFVAIADASSTAFPSIVVQQRGPKAALWVVPQNSATSFGSPIVVPLPQTQQHADTGFDVFHIPTGSSVACMNCHPEGGDDGHTWKFQTATETRLRRTQSLHGGAIAGSAPYHWDGDMTDLQALCDEVFTHRMGGGRLLSSQTVVLARWLSAIPRIPVRTDLDPNRVAAGKALFDGAAGCAGCHTGGAGTLPTNTSIGKIDSAGSTSPLQVPMLVDVADRAPYMHDGCAQNLMQRFTGPVACVGTTHGNTAGLSTDDLTDLISYLESL